MSGCACSLIEELPVRAILEWWYEG